MFEFNHGIKISGTSLWLDATKKVPFSFISHAHSDHIRHHKQIIATPPTVSLFQQRYGKVNATALNFGIPHQIDDIQIELFPAGHILGSAQILIIKNGLRLVYTGDFNTRPSYTAESLEVRNADILIMESTFGLPQYRFPPREQAVDQLTSFIKNCFSHSILPVIMAYTLGKSQEIIKILGELNFQMSIAKPIYQLLKIYEEYGIPFRNYKLYKSGDLDNRVMIIPPYLKNWIDKQYHGPIKKAIVTGWAIDSGARFRYGVDEAFTFSDHADFDDLIAYAKKVSPQTIYILHGFEKFAYYLRQEGFDARILTSNAQLSFL
jgi:putative mRNA 3-end processing factor